MDDKCELPHELDLAFYARDIGALPEAGGIYDQPAGLLRRMRIAYNIFVAWSDWKRLPADKIGDWITAYPGRHEIVQMILEARNG